MNHKKITAKFETVDLAEFAARGIKNNFDRINHIKIRYKNNPKDDYSENENREDRNDEPFNFPALAGVAAGLDSGGSTMLPVYVYLNQNGEENGRRKVPEIEQTTESRIIVESDASIAKQVASKLRCLGGYQIEIY